jgi:RNA 2',3'-cyclic 3'-phosphodiesterase
MSLNSQTEIQRLFFALWPEEALREQLAHLSRQVVGKRGKRVRSENLHLTLIFLGSMTMQQRACAEATARAIGGMPFELRLEQIGYWPRPRIIWLGPQETPQPLVDLVWRLNKGLNACGHQPEVRPYQAHMTLARKVAGPFSPRQVTPLVWQVDHFCLVRSITEPEGVQYQVLCTWPLGQGS